MLLTKNVSLHINYMLRQHFLLAPRFVWNFEFLEVPFYDLIKPLNRATYEKLEFVFNQNNQFFRSDGYCAYDAGIAG